MKLVSIRENKYGYQEKLVITYKQEHDSWLSSFTYFDSENMCNYSSQLFIQKTKWAVVKIATIYAEKYFHDNKIKDSSYFIQKVWKDFLATKEEILEEF